jgi:hypothetical protein
MEVSEERTAQRCDNCQTERPTARLDIGKGAATCLCAICWAQLMAWRQRQNARQKKSAFAVLPWPLAESATPTNMGVDAPQPIPRRRSAR